MVKTEEMNKSPMNCHWLILDASHSKIPDETLKKQDFLPFIYATIILIVSWFVIV